MSTRSLADANVLITGGSDGIGLGLARRFLEAGSTVLITGRNQQKLQKAQGQYARLSTLVSDISSPSDREALADHVREQMPNLNILINNAGIQRRVSIASETSDWHARQIEIDTLLSGPVHLTQLLLPIMLKQAAAGLVVNVTSGGAFVPQVFAPLYSSCKAALHSYTETLRHALQQTHLHVVELAPPAVRTSLAGPGATHGVDLDEFCDAVFLDLHKPSIDFIGFGPTASTELRKELDLQRERMLQSAQRFEVAVCKS